MRARRSGMTILVAEDSATQAEQLRYLLEENGYSVNVASNGRRALDSARAEKPTLIITDIVMPEMDGYALCKAVKQDPGLNDVPVIILTALSSMMEIAKSLECGADSFVRKPYGAANLLSRVGYILANRELRKGRGAQMGLEIYLAGKKHFINSEREQILDLLLSSYEEAIKANEELKLRAAQLETANKELESFTSSVSHDLRAPLRVIDGHAHILEQDCAPKLADEESKSLRSIRESVKRMNDLIEDLLRLARVTQAPLDMHEIDMTRLASQAFEAARQGAVACTIGPLPAAMGDPALLRQVWINLLSNAVKYSARGEAPVVEVTGYAEHGTNVYCVKDNGAGFDMRYYDKLFTVFQRLHTASQFAGTGVGLSIVQRVINRHGGRVWAEGKVGKGASFYFALPMDANARDASRT